MSDDLQCAVETLKTVIIGSYFRDLIFYSNYFPLPGQTINSVFYSGHGGKGSNQAICAHKLGNKNVMFISCVGDDAFGAEIREYYQQNGIYAHFCVSGEPTGCAGIFVQQCDGQNYIYIAEGAMVDLVLKYIKEQLEKRCLDAQLFVFQCEMPYTHELEIMQFVREMCPKALILLNPAPFRPDYDYQVLMKYVDILVPNETELAALVQKLGLYTNSDDYLLLTKLGVEHLIITLGANGSMYINRDTVCTVPAIKVTPIDTTGAGDCFIGGFCAFFNGKNFADAIKMACVAAGLSTEREGTSKSCPTRQEVLAMAAQPEK